MPKIATVDNKMLREGTKVIIEGTLVYSRLASKIEGAELERDIKRKQSFGIAPILKPYTTVTIKDPKIVPLNPDALSPEEVYISERFYTKKGTSDSTEYYTITKTSASLPEILQIIDDRTANQIVLKQELASGLKVQLGVHIFKPKEYPKKGISLDQVMLLEEARYFDNVVNNVFADRGITINYLDQSEKQKLEKEAQRVADENFAKSLGSQTIQPTPAQTQNPFTSAPVQQPTGWECQGCHTHNENDSKFCKNCGQIKSADGESSNNPYQQAGICYNTSDML